MLTALRNASQRENRACAKRDDCTIDVSDGSFQLANCVRLIIIVLVLARSWIRTRFILKSRKSGRRRPDQEDWREKLVRTPCAFWH